MTEGSEIAQCLGLVSRPYCLRAGLLTNRVGDGWRVDRGVRPLHEGGQLFISLQAKVHKQFTLKIVLGGYALHIVRGGPHMKNDRISYVRKHLAQSQLCEFPKYTSCLGLDLEIHRDVFWDDDNNNTGRWITENVPPIAGKCVLELGCGCGLTALFLAKNGASRVLATDITPNAVANTRANARRNGIVNVSSMQSDLYQSVDESARFDHIVFHLPSTRVPDGFAFSSIIEYSSFDPGGSLLDRFLHESEKFLTPTGTMILGYNVSQTESIISDRLGSLRIPHRLIANKKFTDDGMINVHLYEVWPASR